MMPRVDIRRCGLYYLQRIVSLYTNGIRMASSPNEFNPLEDTNEQATSVNGESQDETTAQSPMTDTSTDKGSASSSEEDSSPPNDSASDDSALTFQGDDLDAKLDGASEEELDRADFGIIKIDDDGQILFFNQYESDLSGVDPEDAVGKNFFTEVAPCTNNRLFRGRFKKGLRKNHLDETFTYTYTYRMRPTLVNIHLYRDTRGDNWIMVYKF